MFTKPLTSVLLFVDKIDMSIFPYGVYTVLGKADLNK